MWLQLRRVVLEMNVSRDWVRWICYEIEFPVKANKSALTLTWSNIIYNWISLLSKMTLLFLGSSHNTSLFYFSLRPNIWNILSFQTLLPQQTPKHSPLPLRELKCHLPLHTILLYISSLFLFKFDVYQHFVCLVALFWVIEIEDLKIYGLAFHTFSQSVNQNC